MATVDYTKRRVQLQNLGHVRPVDIPDLSSEWAAAARLGRSIAGFGRDIGRGAVALVNDLAAEQRREDERKVARAAGEIILRNDRRLISPEKDERGNPVGYLLWQGERVKDIQRLGHETYGEISRGVIEEMELDERQTEMLALKLDPYVRSFDRRLMQRTGDELRRMDVADAESVWKRGLETIANGNNTPEMFTDVMQDFDHYLDICGVTGEERKARRETFARSVVVGDLATKASGIETLDGLDAELAALEADPEVALGGKGLVGEILAGNLGENTAREMVKIVKKRRDSLKADQEHVRREQARELEASFVKRELELAQQNLPGGRYADLYESFGNDERLRTLAPETALKYLDTAKRLRAAEKKGVAEATEATLARRMNLLLFREAEGRMDGEDLAAQQAALWRDYKTALLSGGISEGFARSYQTRLTGALADQERTAMKRFYAAFGYRGDLTREGEVTDTARSRERKTAYPVPVLEGEPSETIKGEELFALGETFLATLRSLGPDAYRPEVMEKTLERIKTDWHTDDFNRNRDARVRDILDIQRNLRQQEELRHEQSGSAERSDTARKGSRGGDVRDRDDRADVQARDE